MYSDSDFFSEICVDAIQAVKVQSGGKSLYPVKAINVLKAHGKSARESVLVDGYALNCTNASKGKILRSIVAYMLLHMLLINNILGN